jgi:hypothetical protein
VTIRIESSSPLGEGIVFVEASLLKTDGTVIDRQSFNFTTDMTAQEIMSALRAGLGERQSSRERQQMILDNLYEGRTFPA